MINFQQPLWKIENEMDIFNMAITKFIISGNVDDGKSTLTGRLLYDTGNIKNDTIASLYDQSGEMLMANLTDGLKEETEKKITIDVAYKFFDVGETRFTLIDAPGHFLYLPNFLSGASQADTIILLIDAIGGITNQTRKHALIASFLRIPHWIIAINKLDLVAYGEELFVQLEKDFRIAVATIWHPEELNFIPISALYGENCTRLSQKTPWYKGKTILEALIDSSNRASFAEPNFTCIKPHIIERKEDQFILRCTVLSGKLTIGQRFNAIATTCSVTISDLLYESKGGAMSIMCTVDGALSSNDILVDKPQVPLLALEHFSIILFWVSDTVLSIEDEYIMSIQNSEYAVNFRKVYALQENGFERMNEAAAFSLNYFFEVEVESTAPIVLAISYELPILNRGILIHRRSGRTVGAFMVKP
jgi:sulfate adenylyltransferase subunit 1